MSGWRMMLCGWPTQLGLAEAADFDEVPIGEDDATGLRRHAI